MIQPDGADTFGDIADHDIDAVLFQPGRRLWFRQIERRKAMRPPMWAPYGNHRAGSVKFRQKAICDRLIRHVLRDHDIDVPAGQVFIFLTGNLQNARQLGLQVVEALQPGNIRCSIGHQRQLALMPLCGESPHQIEQGLNFVPPARLQGPQIKDVLRQGPALAQGLEQLGKVRRGMSGKAEAAEIALVKPVTRNGAIDLSAGAFQPCGEDLPMRPSSRISTRRFLQSAGVAGERRCHVGR